MVRVARSKAGLFSVLLLIIPLATALADPSGKEDYVADCARCHGLDGKGSVPEMRMVPGYVAVDLTQLSKVNGGQFPFQQVYDAIDGRRRFPAHLIGDMPTWGLKYQQNPETPNSQEIEKKRISGLVDYIESLQSK